MLNVNLGDVSLLVIFIINLRGTMPLSGCKGTSKITQYKKNPSNLLLIAGIFINY